MTNHPTLLSDLITNDDGRVTSSPGSHPSGHAASGVDGASRFDPSRVAPTYEQLLEYVESSASAGCATAMALVGTSGESA